MHQIDTNNTWDYFIEAFIELSNSNRFISKHKKFYEELMTYGWTELSKKYIYIAITNENVQRCLDKLIDAYLITQNHVLINPDENMVDMIDLFLACGAKFPIYKVLPPRNKFKKFTDIDVEDYKMRGILLDYLIPRGLCIMIINQYADWHNIEALGWDEKNKNGDLSYLKYCSKHLQSSF